MRLTSGVRLVGMAKGMVHQYLKVCWMSSCRMNPSRTPFAIAQVASEFLCRPSSIHVSSAKHCKLDGDKCTRITAHGSIGLTESMLIGSLCSQSSPKLTCYGGIQLTCQHTLILATTAMQSNSTLLWLTFTPPLMLPPYITLSIVHRPPLTLPGMGTLEIHPTIQPWPSQWTCWSYTGGYR